MKNTITKLFANIENVIVNQDNYFTENVFMQDLCGHPVFSSRFEKGSHGTISYTNEFNTYWSKSVASLVMNRDLVAKTAQSLFAIIDIIKNSDVDFKIPRSFAPQAAKAANSTCSDFSPRFHLDFDLYVSHYNKIPYDQSKSSGDHSYLIEGLNFKNIEDQNGNSFPNASFLSTLCGQYDFIAYFLNDEEGLLWKIIDAHEDNSYSIQNRLFNIYLSESVKALTALNDGINAFETSHVENEA